MPRRRTIVDPRFPLRLRELRLARGWSLQGLANQVHCTKVHIHNMENRIGSPSPEMAGLLDEALGADGELAALVGDQVVDVLAGSASAAVPGDDRPGPIETEDDQHMLSRTAGAAWFGMLPPDAVEPPNLIRFPPTAPRKLEQPHIDVLRSSIGVFEQWDHQYGGGMARAAMGGQFEWVCRAARVSSMTSEVRRGWQSAAARLGDLAGWASFDAGEEGAARRYFLAALQLAGEADDLQQRTHTATSMSRQLVHVGAVHAALDVVGLARLAWRDLPPLGRSVIGIVEARAYGRLGDGEECRRAVNACDEYFAASTPGSEDHTWSYYADEGYVLGDAGHALYDLALMTDDPRQAATTLERLEAAYAMHPPDLHRPRALTMIRVADLKARYGDPEEACSAAEAATADAAQVSSHRLTDDLRTLDRSLSRMGAPSGIAGRVREVRARLQHLAGTDR